MRAAAHDNRGQTEPPESNDDKVTSLIARLPRSPLNEEAMPEAYLAILSATRVESISPQKASPCSPGVCQSTHIFRR